MNIQELPPHSPTYERAALGCVIQDFDRVPDLQGADVNGDLFYTPEAATTWRAVQALAAGGGQRDITGLHAAMECSGELAKVGGYTFLDKCMNEAPSGAALPAFVRDLRRLAQARAAIAAGVVLARDARGEPGKLADHIAAAESALHGIRVRLTGGDTAESNLDALLALTTEWEDAQAGKPRLKIATGFHDLDATLGGLGPGNLVVIAARPAVGKTALAMNIAEDLAIVRGVPVGVFSLEMVKRELLSRMIASRARVNVRDLNEGRRLPVDDMDRVIEATGRIKAAPLHIVDKGGLTAARLAGLARRMVDRHGLKLLVIDYLNLLESTNPKASRYERTTDASVAIKLLAKELGIPVILCAQLNRDSDREDRPPRMSDLRDSGSIEQDADMLMLLHPDTAKGTIKVIVAKNRHGAVGAVDLVFRREFTRIEDTPIEDLP